MQTITAIDDGIIVINPLVLIIGALILISIIVIVEYRKGKKSRRYWIIASVKAAFVFTLWQLASIALWILIMTYTMGSIEYRINIVNFGNALVYVGLALLLLLYETHHKVN